jgi:hypothetical protein
VAGPGFDHLHHSNPGPSAPAPCLTHTGATPGPEGFEEPEQAPALLVTYDLPATPWPERLVTHDVATGEWTLEVDPNYRGSRTYPDASPCDGCGRHPW